MEGRMTREELRQRVEIERTVRFWGQEHQVTPLLLREVLGDGKRLMWFQPLAYRPNYYVIQVDSRWAEDAFYDHLEEVYDALAFWFGETNDDDEDDEGNPVEEKGWPMLNTSCGSQWGHIRWRDVVTGEVL